MTFYTNNVEKFFLLLKKIWLTFNVASSDEFEKHFNICNPKKVEIWLFGNFRSLCHKYLWKYDLKMKILKTMEALQLCVRFQKS